MRQARGEPIWIVAAMACLVLAVNLQCTVEAGGENENNDSPAGRDDLERESSENCPELIALALDRVPIPEIVQWFTLNIVSSIGEETLYTIDEFTTLITVIKRPPECDKFVDDLVPSLKNNGCTKGENFKKLAESSEKFKKFLWSYRVCEVEVIDPKAKQERIYSLGPKELVQPNSSNE